MSLVALGLNHKTAPVDIREQIAFSAEEIVQALQGLSNMPAVNEVAIISTCNRTEIYCDLDSDVQNPAIDWLIETNKINTETPADYLYHYLDVTMVRHILRVACGLDSMVLGEPQILGQLKSAFQAAEQAGTIGSRLGRLFQHAFAVAKQVRTETSIGANPVSVAYTAVNLAKRIFADLHQQQALLIGAGETIELTAQHLKSKGIKKLFIANRTLENAQKLANKFDGIAITLSDITATLPYADIVISSTASQLPILGKGTVESALKTRKHQPIFLVDLAVPRDIEPEVGELDDAFLYSIDDLQTVIEENQQSRQAAAEEAETIIELKVQEFMDWQRSLSAVETIRQYRNHANNLSQEVLETAKQMIANGKHHDEAMEYLANTLTNKLVHTPTIRIRELATEGKNPLLELAGELFQFNYDNQNKK